MPKTTEGKLVVQKGQRFALVCSRFNEFITTRLLSGCLDALKRHGADESQVEVFWVPGSLEIPLVAQKLACSKKFDALICLGAIIRGATPHFEYVAAEAAKGVASVMLKSEKPVIFGIITSDSIEQAIERAGTKDGNKGFSAAVSAIEMANLLAEL